MVHGDKSGALSDIHKLLINAIHKYYLNNVKLMQITRINLFYSHTPSPQHKHINSRITYVVGIK